MSATKGDSVKEELFIEKRIKEIHEITRLEGWKHVESIFRDQIADLMSIHSLNKYPKEQKLEKMEVHSEVASRLQTILDIVLNTATQYEQTTVDEIRIYGAEDYGGDEL